MEAWDFMDKIDIEVAEMVALSERNEQKVNEVVEKLFSLIKGEFDQANFRAGLRVLVFEQLLDRFDLRIQGDGIEHKS
jgi:hypothetical protein